MEFDAGKRAVGIKQVRFCVGGWVSNGPRSAPRPYHSGPLPHKSTHTNQQPLPSPPPTDSPCTLLPQPKNKITANEPQFTGHFPERPIMPGVLMVEAMAQLSGVLCLQAPVSDGKGLFFFAGGCSRRAGLFSECVTVYLSG